MYKIFTMFVSLLLLSTSMKTTQPINYLREGPASYYDVILSLPASTSVEVLEKNTHWFKVKVGNDIGWLAENSFSEKTNSNTEKLLQGKPSSRASKAELAAAVKGFAHKYVPETTKENLTLNKYSASIIPQSSIEEFARTFSNQEVRSYKSLEKPFDIDLQEEGIGLGIAQKVACSGLLKNQTLLQYLNMVGSHLVNYTKAYHTTFRFYVLEDNRVNAFACPGGYIFFSYGLIRLCSNESELAAVLAHEMAHVIQRHGMKELKVRQPKVKAGNAFDELDEEVGEEISEDEKDLEQFANDAYDVVVSERLIEYEKEADELAMLYLYRAGYDPTSVVKLLEKIQEPLKTKPDIFDINFMKGDAVKKRLQYAKEIMDDEGYKNNIKKQYVERFQKYNHD